MREGIGSIALYNIIIIFIAVTFAVLAGTMSYSKAFKVNNRIINAIEKYEGYNELAASKIDEVLLSIGYPPNGSHKCSKKQGMSALASLNESYDFCVYQFVEETREWNGRYSTFGVKTFINIDLPIIGEFVKVPVYGRSKMVFSFLPGNAPGPQITKYLSIALKDNELVDLYLNKETGKLTFRKGEAVDIRNLITVYMFSSDDVSYVIEDYGIVDFSTNIVGQNLQLTVRWGEDLSASLLYDVVER